MLSLPIVFICNTLLFMAVMNGRFRVVTNFLVSGAAYVLSLILSGVLSPAFNDTTGSAGNAINVFLLLAAAVFLYTNNLAQKIFVAILLLSS